MECGSGRSLSEHLPIHFCSWEQGSEQGCQSCGPGWVHWRLEVCSPWRPSRDGMWWQHRDGPSSRRAGPDPGFDFHPEEQEVRAQPLAGVTRVSRSGTGVQGAGRGPDHEPTAVSPSELRAGHGKWGDWPITGWPADGALACGRGRRVAACFRLTIQPLVLTELFPPWSTFSKTVLSALCGLIS